MNLIFGSSALIAYLRNEQGADAVRELLRDPVNACLVHAVSWCEVYYEARRHGGEEFAQASLALLRKTGLLRREDMEEYFCLDVGRLKADFRRISLADCFCAALANRLGCEVVTADRSEFQPLADANICKVTLIR